MDSRETTSALVKELNSVAPRRGELFVLVPNRYGTRVWNDTLKEKQYCDKDEVMLVLEMRGYVCALRLSDVNVIHMTLADYLYEAERLVGAPEEDPE